MRIRKSCAAALVLAALAAFGAEVRADEPRASPAPPAAATAAESAPAATEAARPAPRSSRLRPYSATARCGNRRPGATGHFLRRGTR